MPAICGEALAKATFFSLSLWEPLNNAIGRTSSAAYLMAHGLGKTPTVSSLTANMRTSGDPTSARPPLPLEILITIAEFLEYDARETLLRFSVVCCQFRSAAWAAGLFSEIHIQPLLNVDGSPSVDYESSDYYTDPNAECEPTDYDAPTEDEEYVSLTLKDQWDPRRHIGAFKFLLECLKNTPRMSNAVRSVHVSASSYFDGIMVPPSLLRAVLVQLPNLRDLQLSEVDAWDGPVPDDVLASCPDMAGTVRLEWLDVHRSRVCVPKPHPAYFARILQAVDEVKDLYLWDLSLEVYFLRPAPRSRPLKLSQIRVPDYHSGYTRGRIPNILWMWSQTIDPASLQIITVSPCCRDVVTQLNALLKRCHKLVKIKLNIRRPCCYDWRGAHGQTWTGRPQWNSCAVPLFFRVS